MCLSLFFLFFCFFCSFSIHYKSIMIYVYRESQQNLLSFFLLQCGFWIVWFEAPIHDRNTWSQVDSIFAEPIIIIFFILKRKSQSVWCHIKTPSFAHDFEWFSFMVFFLLSFDAKNALFCKTFNFPDSIAAKILLVLNLFTLPDGRSIGYFDTEKK